MPNRCCGNFNCSKLFVGVDGIDLEFGLTTTNMLEAALNRVMMNAAQKVIVLADSSKFGRRGFSKICDLEAVDRIITDNGIQPLYLDRLRERGIEVIGRSTHDVACSDDKRAGCESTAPPVISLSRYVYSSAKPATARGNPS